MYSDFNVSIFGTSTPPQLSQSHTKIQIEFILERSILGIPDESAENAKKQAVVVAMEQKQEASASTPPSSSSSSSENQVSKEVASKTEIGEAADDDGDEEDGYRTPTSPRHRIPPAIECPPAPKKPRMPKRWRCIRVRTTTETRRVRLCARNPTMSARGRRRSRRRRPEEM